MKRSVVLLASVLLVVAFGLSGVGLVGATPSSDSISPGPTLEQVVTATNTTTTASNGTTNTTTTASDGTTNTTTTASDGPTNTTLTNVSGTPSSIPPGARLAGVVGIQEAEFQGDMAVRTFEHRVSGPISNETRARVVANETEHIRERLQTLERQRDRLTALYNNNSIPRGTYVSRMAKLTAEINSLQYLINRTNRTAHMLPPGLLAAHGVNETAIEQLRTHARFMTGPEIAEFAREIGGPMAGHPLGKEQPGPPMNVPGQGGPRTPPGRDGRVGMPGNSPDNASNRPGPPGTNAPMMPRNGSGTGSPTPTSGGVTPAGPPANGSGPGNGQPAQANESDTMTGQSNTSNEPDTAKDGKSNSNTGSGADSAPGHNRPVSPGNTHVPDHAESGSSSGQ
ncbi:MAG: hypothetical protein ABEJ58_06310 [Halodesulfurarchaeum sp.]